MKHQLIVTILGTDKIGILSTLAATVGACNCNILDSRQAVYGQDFSLTMILEGTQSAIIKAELQIPQVCQQHELLSMMKRTKQHLRQDIAYLADVEVSGVDFLGVIKEITAFFDSLDITVTAFRQQTYTDPQSGLEMVQCKMVVSMSNETDLGKLEAEFAHKLNELNLQGTIKKH
ncbi:glycine cleavage system transcriptional repressor [Bowmanella sp. Y26]|uniref:Glycine cleavage system transcriptional repressor n=1 Tax=Bowmanella yangjiangensis TaxID=2811230 RepID=A0ABS3CVF4_9ALTE|nr:ACT domain-containing protein [Bowmanella yangjiangensis]MBN7821107.1 glycine cleavage system transcriptional repressor [Bowmanella yangjiangensis]MBT1065142.1 glycine cleavage system transcriptional repressor [Bowmanella yangjiangensis]